MHTITHAAAGPRGERLADSDLFALIARHGAVYLKGVVRNHEDFAALTDRVGHRWFDYPRRRRPTVSASARIQTVSPGNGTISPHAELSFSPYHPHLGGFCCIWAASEGGATTLYDGCAVAETMSAELRSYFAGRQFLYRGRWGFEEGFDRFGVEDEAALRRLIEEKGWEDRLWIDGDMVVQKLFRPCFAHHAPTGREAFITHLVHLAKMRLPEAMIRRWLAARRRPPVAARLGSKAARLIRKTTSRRDDRPIGVTAFPLLDDGSIVPGRIVRALHETIIRHEARVHWEAGDVVIFDNTRMMHGREAFSGQERVVLTRFGFPKSELPILSVGNEVAA